MSTLRNQPDSAARGVPSERMGHQRLGDGVQVADDPSSLMEPLEQRNPDADLLPRERPISNPLEQQSNEPQPFQQAVMPDTRPVSSIPTSLPAEKVNVGPKQITDGHGKAYPTPELTPLGLEKGPHGMSNPSQQDVAIVGNPTWALSASNLLPTTIPASLRHTLNDGFGTKPVEERLNYDEIGLTFVTSFGKTDSNHLSLIPNLVEKRNLMEYILPYPYGSIEDKVALRVNLLRLLELSWELSIPGVVTPIMAWSTISWSPRFRELTIEDLVALLQILKTKAKDFEFGVGFYHVDIWDALNTIFAAKPEAGVYSIPGLALN